jgi:N-methylhydantoinase A
MAPGLTLCISSEVLPEIKEYERTSTTVINAYVRPIVEKYLSALTTELARIGVDEAIQDQLNSNGIPRFLDFF